MRTIDTKIEPAHFRLLRALQAVKELPSMEDALALVIEQHFAEDGLIRDVVNLQARNRTAESKQIAALVAQHQAQPEPDHLP